jgi:hypothetical protein
MCASPLHQNKFINKTALHSEISLDLTAVHTLPPVNIAMDEYIRNVQRQYHTAQSMTVTGGQNDLPSMVSRLLIWQIPPAAAGHPLYQLKASRVILPL